VAVISVPMNLVAHYVRQLMVQIKVFPTEAMKA